MSNLIRLVKSLFVTSNPVRGSETSRRNHFRLETLEGREVPASLAASHPALIQPVTATPHVAVVSPITQIHSLSVSSALQSSLLRATEGVPAARLADFSGRQEASFGEQAIRAKRMNVELPSHLPSALTASTFSQVQFHQAGELVGIDLAARLLEARKA